MTPAPTIRCVGTCKSIARTLRALAAQLASPAPHHPAALAAPAAEKLVVGPSHS